MNVEPGFSQESLYLALDTSGPLGSVAVSRGVDVLARNTLGARSEHASGLVPAIDRALDEAGVGRRELQGVVVGEGPGSFTGVRVAAATAKGLVHALSVPLWAISSLTAAALASDIGAIRYLLFDAPGDRVYGACFGMGRAGVQTLVPPHAGTLRDALDGDVPGGAIFVGDAACRHRAAIEGAGFTVAPEEQGVSLADGLLRYLALNPGALPVSHVDAWEPRYVRASSAEPLWTA